MNGSTAARVRETKEKHPERFCANKTCLWNISTGKPCPKHPLINNMCGMNDQFITDQMHAHRPTTREEIRQQRTERIHAAGARRHGSLWFDVNIKAVEVLWDAEGLRVNDPEVKRVVATIVLRTLDTVQTSQGRSWDEAASAWIVK